MFTEFQFLDEYQLDVFIRTTLGATILYNNLRWDSQSNKLTIYTTENDVSADTSLLLKDALTSYPNAPPDLTATRNERAVNTGEISVFSAQKNKQVVLPKGNPGQFLTVDPDTESGLAWASFSTESSNGGSLTTTDDYIRYMELYTLTPQKFGPGVPTPLLLKVERRKDLPTFEHELSSEIFSTTEVGTLTFSFKVGFQWASQPKSTNAKIRVFIQAKAISAFIWEDIPGGLAYCTLDARYANSETSTFLQFPRHCAAGDAFRIMCVEDSDTNLVQTSGHSLVSVCKIEVGGILYDTSSFLYFTNCSCAHNQIVSPDSPTDVEFSDSVILTGNYSKISDSQIKVSISSGFYVLGRVTLETFGGDVGDSVYCEMQLLTDYGSGGNFWSSLPGGTCNLDMTVSENSASRQQGTVCCIPLLPADSILKVSLTILGTTNPNVVVEVVREASSFYSINFATTDINSGLKCLDIVGINQNKLTASQWDDIQLNVATIQDSIFTQDPQQTMIQCSEPGTYLVYYRVSVFLSSPDPQSIGNVCVRLCVNGSQEFYEALGSRASTTVTSEKFATMVGSCLLNLGNNYQIKLQGLLNNVGSVKPTDILSTVPNQVEFIMAKLENTKISVPAPGLLVFGTYYSHEVEASKTSNIGTDYVEKLSLTTHNLTSGMYKISCNYFFGVSSPSAKFISRLVQDDVTTISEITSSLPTADVEGSRFNFDILNLSAGVHRFSLQWKSNAEDTTSTIRACKLEFYRVG